MKNKVKRRDFIKILGAGTGGVVIGSQVLRAFPDKEDSVHLPVPGEKGYKKTPTYCEVCFWKCAGWVHQKDDEPWKITGNDDDLNSRGRFCPRGTGGVGQYTDPDRLKTPLIRVEKNGKQVFQKASWDEAFSVIADKLQVISDKWGPECVALFTH